MRTICTQIIVDGLFITNVNEDAFEDAHVGCAQHRDGQAALHHILQQANAFQAYGFAAGVGSGNNKDSFFGQQADVQRNHLFVMFFVVEVE